MLSNRCPFLALTIIVALCWASAAQAAFVYDTVADLALWLKADADTTLVGGRVDQWADQSGVGNHAAAVSDAGRPLLTTAMIGANSHNVLRFNGTSNALTLGAGADVDISRQDHTAFFVAARTGGTAAATGNLFGFDRTGGRAQDGWYYKFTQGQVNMEAGYGSDYAYYLASAQPNNRFVLGEGRFSTAGTTATLHIDGQLKATDTAVNTPLNEPANTRLNIGAFDLPTGSGPATGFTNFLQGDVAEILVFNRALTEAEQSTVRSYLNQKYWYSDVSTGVDHVITHGDTTVQLPFRVVGDKGNAGDTLVRNDGTSGYGAVDHTYQMGEYAISWDVWNEVAAAAGITLGVGTAGTGNQPVNWGRWYAAAQFANWLTTGDKYQGAYTFTFDDDDNPTQITGVTINRDFQNDAGFAYVLPTEDEWYKAAYYKGGNTDAGYWRYPTQQNDSPTGVASGTDPYTAVFGPQAATASVYEAGGRSAYGTMGQGGNVWEWTESGTSDAPNANRWRFGGERGHANANELDAIRRSGNSRAPDFASVAIGFRIATTARLNEPQRFDFGSDPDKYRHNVYRHGVDAPANWLVLQGVPAGTISYQPDAVRISSGTTSPNDNSVGLLTDFDNLGNGQKNRFVASMTFTMTAGTSSNHSYDKFQLWALGDESLATGGEGNTGYVVSMARTATWPDRRLHLVKGGWDDDGGQNSIYASDGIGWNPVLGDVLTVELHGTYGRQDGVDGLFLDLYTWNETRNEFQEFTGFFDPNPHDGSGFGFGLRTGGSGGSAPTMDVYRFSVIPEPGSWVLLLGLACGLLLRRRHGVT